MNIIKNFFSFAILAAVFATFSAAPVQAQTGGALKIQMHVEPLAAGYIKFDGVDGECTVKEGRNVVGKNTRTNEQLIVVIKGGKLSAFGTQARGGSFKPLPQNANPCNPTLSCTTFNPPHCYTLLGGECVCVCGPWISNGGSGQN
jgi:hypothetical protein